MRIFAEKSGARDRRMGGRKERSGGRKDEKKEAEFSLFHSKTGDGQKIGHFKTVSPSPVPFLPLSLSISL